MLQAPVSLLWELEVIDTLDILQNKIFEIDSF